MEIETILWIVITLCGIGIGVLCLRPVSPSYRRGRLSRSKNGRGREEDYE